MTAVAKTEGSEKWKQLFVGAIQKGSDPQNKTVWGKSSAPTFEDSHKEFPFFAQRMPLALSHSCFPSSHQ
jgi:hypothetical protein